MIANSAFLAAMVLLLMVFGVFGQLEFLAPYKSLILTDYLWGIVGGLVVLFLNLFSGIYLIGRGLFLKDTGRKLAHVEKLLHTPDTVAHGLSEHLAKDE